MSSRRDESPGPPAVPADAAQPVDATSPLDLDGTTTVALGTAVWALVGLVLLVFFRDTLVAEQREWWLWTCLAGVGIGLLGWAYCRRRRDRLRAARGGPTAT